MEPVVALMPGGIGSMELLVLFLLVLIIFGPKRLPELARKLGNVMEQLRKAASLFQGNLLSMDDDPLADELLNDPPDTLDGAYGADDGYSDPVENETVREDGHSDSSGDDDERESDGSAR